MLTLTDDYVDEFFGENHGVTEYKFDLNLIERNEEEEDPNDPYWVAVRDEYTAEVVEDLENMQDLYDHRVYDLRNTTLEEVLNNENEDVTFHTISIHDVLYDYDTEEVQE